MTKAATTFISLLLTIALIILPPPTQANNIDEGDYSINYWTDYAIYPIGCITYNNLPQIVYSMYAKSYNHCSDSPIGTYVTTVENYVGGYLDQMMANAYDEGVDYSYPDMASYVNCTYEELNGVGYYLQVGCGGGDASSSSSTGSRSGLSVNVYDDATCTNPVSIDTSSYGLPNDMTLNYKKCTPCVIWMDKNDDEIDDGYYENKQKNAPLCNAAWDYKEVCDGKCQAKARESKVREGWNKADKVLLTVLSLFGFGMLITIVKKRQKMSNKDALLEQAAISAAGLQQSHVLGIFALLILIILMFALLGLKKITWALLLLLNIVLFAYLMKLTVDGSVKETIVGPDGKIIERDDSDEYEDDEDDEAVNSPTSAENTYENPNLPQLS